MYLHVQRVILQCSSLLARNSPWKKGFFLSRNQWHNFVWHGWHKSKNLSKIQNTKGIIRSEQHYPNFQVQHSFIYIQVIVCGLVLMKKTESRCPKAARRKYLETSELKLSMFSEPQHLFSPSLENVFPKR